MRPVDRNVDVIQTGRDQQLVDFRGTDGPHIVERIGLIGPVEELRCTVRVAVKRLIFQICEVHAAKLQPLFIGQVHIGAQCVFSLFRRVEPGREPVAVAADGSTQVGNRPGIQNPDAVRA